MTTTWHRYGDMLDKNPLLFQYNLTLDLVKAQHDHIVRLLVEIEELKRKTGV